MLLALLLACNANFSDSGGAVSACEETCKWLRPENCMADYEFGVQFYGIVSMDEDGNLGRLSAPFSRCVERCETIDERSIDTYAECIAAAEVAAEVSEYGYDEDACDTIIDQCGAFPIPL